MDKTLSFILFVLLLGAAEAVAHPPSELELNYNKEDVTLSVSMRHVTRDFHDHYIRKIEVYINDEEQDSIFNHRQINPTYFEKDIPLNAKPGDAVVVKFYCSEGGLAEGGLIIPEEDDPKESDG